MGDTGCDRRLHCYILHGFGWKIKAPQRGGLGRVWVAADQDPTDERPMLANLRTQQTGRALIWALLLLGAASGAVALVVNSQRSGASARGGEADEAVTLPETDLVPPHTGHRLGKLVKAGAVKVESPEDGKGKIVYPGDFAAESLNGVTNPLKPLWKHGNYTPIVAKETAYWDGIGVIEWYVHADGTRSTTLGLVHGHKQPVTLVQHAMPKGWAEQPPPKTVLMEDVLKEGEGKAKAPTVGK